MINSSNDVNIITKSEKNLDNLNFTSSPKDKTNQNINSKNYLPSFFFKDEKDEKEEDYFNAHSSDSGNISNEEKEINEINEIKNNISDKDGDNIFQFEKMKIFDNNIINNQNTNINNSNYQKNLLNNKNINNNIIISNINKNNINNNERINYTNKINNNNENNLIQNANYSFPLNIEKNFKNNSFNNRTSNNYYQNYFNLSNDTNLNHNIFNNVNIINNNNFVNNNSYIKPYANSFGTIFPQFNSLNFQQMFSVPIKQNNNNINVNNYNYFDNNKNMSYNQIDKNKCFSFTQPFTQIQNNLENISFEKIKKKKSKKDKVNEDNILNGSFNMNIKKLLNMTDYSLYNYLINQKGSRDVQMALKKIKENEVEILINKLKDYISDITIDKYGNYFIQKLFQICVPSQRIKVLQNINNRFVEISNNSCGTHPIQTLMEIINMPEEKKLVLSYILGNECALSLDSKGTHVLQKFISNTVDEEREQLNKNIINLIEKLIIDPYGVCVLIKLVKHTQDKTISQKIANYITQNGPLYFIQHPYANYAVQILINSTDLSYCGNIIETIVNNYLSLSMQKFSSNVVENCIKYGDENTVKKIYKSIIEQEKLESLLNNNYGNFVLEKLIARLTKEEKIKFIKKIEKLGKTKTLSNSLRNLLYE